MPSSTLPLPAPAARRRSGLRSGFTLLEIMVVLAILGLLVGVLVTKVGKSFDSAQTQVAQIFVTQTMKTPLTQYKIDMGDYPSTEEGLQALFVAPQNNADRWHGPYAEGNKAPLDPWGQPYHYRYPGTHNKDGYDLWSSGPDKTDGTDDDIKNW